jgi:hypothetical protein
MPRYVILEHNHPKLHWDFMLEAGEVLRTWKLSACPEAGREVAAEPAADHRPLYLDYEGPVSGDRGTVKRWDWGTFIWRNDELASITVNLDGQQLQGIIQLQRQQTGSWTLTFEPV